MDKKMRNIILIISLFIIIIVSIIARPLTAAQDSKGLNAYIIVFPIMYFALSMLFRGLGNKQILFCFSPIITGIIEVTINPILHHYEYISYSDTFVFVMLYIMVAFIGYGIGIIINSIISI